VTGRVEVGEYWDRDLQIDVVGLRADGWIDLGECKWQGRPAVAAVVRELEDRAAHYPGRSRTVQPRAFLRTRPKSGSAGIRVHDLVSLYDEC
jgi:hypothetical protein